MGIMLSPLQCTRQREPCPAVHTVLDGSLPCTQQPITQPHCFSARTRMALRSEGRHAPPGAHAQACRRGGGIEAGTSSTRSQPDAARPLRRKVRTLPALPDLKHSLKSRCRVHRIVVYTTILRNYLHIFSLMLLSNQLL